MSNIMKVEFNRYQSTSDPNISYMGLNIRNVLQDARLLKADQILIIPPHDELNPALLTEDQTERFLDNLRKRLSIRKTYADIEPQTEIYRVIKRLGLHRTYAEWSIGFKLGKEYDTHRHNPHYTGSVVYQIMSEIYYSDIGIDLWDSVHNISHHFIYDKENQESPFVALTNNENQLVDINDYFHIIVA